MILKNYQVDAINNLERFLELLNGENSISVAFEKFWNLQDKSLLSPYHDTVPDVPRVCFKVPTGGGKTLMAAASLKPICNYMKHSRNQVVVWLVPSDAILTQTCKNLKNPEHPYRQRLQIDFGNIKVYTKEELLFGADFSPQSAESQLSIFVLSYDSFRKKNKEYYKAFQENGYLDKFTPYMKGDEILDGAEENSLIQVIRHYNPIIIVDESHHAVRPLSVEMLVNFNPCFILELTATPRENANIIAYVHPFTLKEENMVKIPVMVKNCTDKDELYSLVIMLRNNLEVKAADENIRPIVLFQAESKGSEERSTFDKIREKLINDYKIPADEIAIKTAEINELKNIDLTAKVCKIKYIITINALKEGWDCPFAYILASLANKNSPVDVEQILGRILRRPFTKRFLDEDLNKSYVFTSSNDFNGAVENIIKTLNSEGFEELTKRLIDENQAVIGDDDIDARGGNFKIGFDDENDENKNRKINDGERTSMNIFKMQDKFSHDEIILPQLFYKTDDKKIIQDEPDFVSREVLCRDFSLTEQNAAVNFYDLNYQVAEIDIKNKDDVPRYKYTAKIAEIKYFDKDLKSPEEQRSALIKSLAAIIDTKMDNLAIHEINEYVRRIVSKFDTAAVREAFINSAVYVNKIMDKINTLMSEHARKVFNNFINENKITAQPYFKLPAEITPLKYTQNIASSLYTAEEDDMNEFEYNVAVSIASLDNILWWHRNRSQKHNGFYINGFINHYPDFIVKTKSGVILIVETKGDDRDNTDSKLKLELGREWANLAGADKYKYFMVFKDNDNLDGALKLEQFLATIKKL